MTDKTRVCECGSTFNIGSGRGAHLRKKCDDCKSPSKAAKKDKELDVRMCRCGKGEVEGRNRICDDCKEFGRKFKQTDDGDYVEISDHEFNEAQRVARQERADKVVADLMFQLELQGKTLKQNPR